MSQTSLLPHREIIRALNRDGWVVVGQRGSHIRRPKHFETRTLNITVPAHNPVKRSTLRRILKDAELEPSDFTGLL